MIEFSSENDFKLENEIGVASWISEIIESENRKEGEVTYVFCDDEFLHKLNVEFLNHDTLTDIITFDYSLGNQINGEIYISTERVVENAETFNVSFEDELHRVIIHGILHLCGHKDKLEEESNKMRDLEDLALNKRKI